MAFVTQNDSYNNTFQFGTPYPYTLCLVMQTVGTNLWGCAVAQLLEALRYKSEGRWFDSMRSTHPPTEMSTRNMS